jgi:hypothetical protein
LQAEPAFDSLTAVSVSCRTGSRRQAPFVYSFLQPLPSWADYDMKNERLNQVTKRHRQRAKEILKHYY